MTTSITSFWRLLSLWIFVTLLFSSPLAAQPGNASVTVFLQNNKPLSDAIVKVVPLSSPGQKGKEVIGFSNSVGVYSFPLSEPAIVQISHLGYTTITDTIFTPESKTYTFVPSSQNIQDVVVTGQYAPNSVQKSVYEVQVIGSDVIKSKGANNLREVLQNELSIDLGQDAVFGSSIGINGISGEGVKIMVDGVPIVGRLDGKLDLSQITINNIERIEIVEGPLSVMYGTDAMGGVVNIITKTFQKEKVNLNLKGYYETAGHYNAELNAGFAFKKNQFFLSGGRNFFDGYSAADSAQRVKEWKPKEQYFADAKYMFTGSRFRFSLSGAFFRELLLDRGAPKRTLSFDNNDTAWTYLGNDAHRITYRPRAAASLMYRFKENSQVDVLLGYSGFIRFSNLYTKNLVTLKEQIAPPDQHDTATYHHIVFRPTYSLPAWQNRLNFQFGIDINQEFTTQTRIEGGSKKAGDYAAFGSVKITLAEGLDVQPAIRFSYNTLFPVPLIPSLNLRYNYKDKLVFRVSYGRGYRAPSLKELYLTFFDSNHALRGNSELTPEDGHNINGSINYTRPVGKTHRLIFHLSGFYNNIRNKIDYLTIISPGPDLDTFQYFNLKKYITYGGELSMGYEWKRLHLKAAAQLTRYELSNTGSKSDLFRLLSPSFSANASYVIPKAEIRINIFYKYTGTTPLFGNNGSYQTGTRFAYHSLDISLSRAFWKNRIQLIVGGKNLAGVTNVQASNISGVGHNFGGNAVNIGWGRTFFTSLVLHFSK